MQCIYTYLCCWLFILGLQERLKKLKKEHGSKELGSCTVEAAIGGMRGIPVGCSGGSGGCWKPEGPSALRITT